jgi:serine-type D-Ala-D-Ala carboxypeptidase/endopeptidase (penicillin-binding protein 4)
MPKSKSLRFQSWCLSCSLLSGLVINPINPGISMAADAPSLPAASSSVTICPAAINQTIQNIASRYNLQRYHWGLYVQPLTGAVPLANYQGQNLFIPASTTKLLTTAATLRQLGGAYRLRTSIYQSPAGNALAPTLTVVGRGDPTMTTNQLQILSAQLKSKGLRQISQLNIGSGYFRGASTNPDWEWGDLTTDYGVPTTSLILQQNAVDLVVSPQQAGQPVSYSWRNPLNAAHWQLDNRSVTSQVGTTSNITVQGILGKPWLQLNGQLPASGSPQTLNVAMLDPIDTWRSQFQSNLRQQGITVDRTQVLTGEPPQNGVEVAAVESPTLIELVKEINRQSNNLYAEVLLRTLGRTNPNHATSKSDTADLGLEMVSKKLTEIGVSPAYYRQADGSGLSRKNLIAPIGLVQTLIGMSKTPEGQLYRDSLSVAGVNGSLKNRFKDTKNIIQGKTGSLTGVAALAGYINPPQYQPLAFSIIVNNHDRPNSEIRAAMDEMVGTFAKLRPCS